MRQVRRMSFGNEKSLTNRNSLVDRAGKFLQHVTQSVPVESAVRRVARIPDEVGDRVRNLFFQRKHLNPLATVLMVVLGACTSSYPAFQPGSTPATKFEADASVCRGEAQAVADAEVGRAERYDDGSDAEIIGAGLGAMLASNSAAKQQYRACMQARGYNK